MENKNKYSHITVEELLHDDYFISSMIAPTTESRVFWEEMLADGGIDPVCYARARDFLLMLTRSSRQYNVRKERMNVVWDRIDHNIHPSNGKTDRPKKQHRIHALMWPVALTVSVACIAIALLLRPVSWSRESVMTVNGTPVTAVDSKAVDIIVLSSDDMGIMIEGDEAHLDYSEGLRINEKPVDDSVSPKGDLNMLSVPFGKRSTITLSDGSRLWINAGTKVIYPKEFAGGNREIYVNGEIYGQIAHDPANPFVIKTTKADVTVLGTTLNLNAYETDKDIAVVLVEGRVNITNRRGESSTLAPSQMYYESDGQCHIHTVDVQNHISWKDGVYRFNNVRIEDIIKQLGRYYNVRIQASDRVKGFTCSGELILKEDLSRVLDGICRTARIVYRWDAQLETYYLDH